MIEGEGEKKPSFLYGGREGGDEIHSHPT